MDMLLKPKKYIVRLYALRGASDATNEVIQNSMLHLNSRSKAQFTMSVVTDNAIQELVLQRWIRTLMAHPANQILTWWSS